VLFIIERIAKYVLGSQNTLEDITANGV